MTYVSHGCTFEYAMTSSANDRGRGNKRSVMMINNKFNINDGLCTKRKNFAAKIIVYKLFDSHPLIIVFMFESFYFLWGKLFDNNISSLFLLITFCKRNLLIWSNQLFLCVTFWMVQLFLCITFWIVNFLCAYR